MQPSAELGSLGVRIAPGTLKRQPPCVRRDETGSAPDVTMGERRIYYGWYIVAACGVIAFFSWGLGFYGLGVYLGALQVRHGQPTTEVVFTRSPISGMLMSSMAQPGSLKPSSVT